MEASDDVGRCKSRVGNIMKKLRNSKLEIKAFKVRVADKEILKGLNLEIKPGEVHALMGPNGSGKSSLAFALAGHPNYRVTGGKIFLGKTDLTGLKPEEKAKAGLFLAFQYPVGLGGVSFFNFLKTAVRSQGEKAGASDLLLKLKSLSAKVGLKEDFLGRDLNFDFSGGEKKRAEVLQALVLKPKFAIFDEIDSGLDVDALRLIARQISFLAQEGTGVLVITHYQRILTHLVPNFVHVLVEGRLIKSGGPELAKQLEKSGYKNL